MDRTNSVNLFMKNEHERKFLPNFFTLLIMLWMIDLFGWIQWVNVLVEERMELFEKITKKSCLSSKSVIIKTGQIMRKLWIFKLSRVSQLVSELNFTFIIFLATLFFDLTICCHCRAGFFSLGLSEGLWYQCLRIMAPCKMELFSHNFQITNIKWIWVNINLP